MNLISLLTEACIYQDLDVMIDDICFNITLKSGVMFFLCFYVGETESTFTFVATSERGTEELKIVPKDTIELVEIVYQLSIDKNSNEEDKSYS